MTVRANVDFGGSSRAGQSVMVYNHGTQVAATIYDTDGVTPLAQPIPVRGNGHVVFSAAAGTYDVVGSDLTRTVVVAADPANPFFTSGLLAGLPPAGTGSEALYWATDDNGGTLYADLSNGAAYTKIAPGVSQAGGRELAFAGATAAASGTAVFDVTGCTITFTVAARPVYVTALVPLVTSTAANGAFILSLTDNANTETAAILDVASPTAGNGSGGGNTLLERIATPGTYTRKLRAQTQAASSGATTAVAWTATRAAHIKAVEA